MTRTHAFELFADYFQFYLEDEAAPGDLSEAWSEEATDRMLAVAPGVVGIGTARNMTVPVVVEIHSTEPIHDFEGWDHVAECHLSVSADRIVIAGCTDYRPDAARIDLSSGDYRVRVSYGRLSELSEDGLDGNDHYRVQLWPGSPTEPLVLKRKPER